MPRTSNNQPAAFEHISFDRLFTGAMFVDSMKLPSNLLSHVKRSIYGKLAYIQGHDEPENPTEAAGWTTEQSDCFDAVAALQMQARRQSQ